MAFRKTLANRFFNMAKASSSSRTTAASLIKNRDQPQGLLRRFFFQSAVPAGSQKLFDRIRGLDGLLPMPVLLPPRNEADAGDHHHHVSIEQAKKVLRASQMEAVRTKLRASVKTQVSYSEFVDLCCDAAGGFDQGLGVAKLLDDSGTVIVLGNTVFLRPDQVARAIESVMPLTTSMPSKREEEEDEDKQQLQVLKAMEAKKAEIDGKAEALVRRELWMGLGLLTLQTTGFMRLTFWELSWDVMEPVCFFVTSIYFLAGYAFFLRTSRDPSFEGFFQSRFAAKQKRLMDTHRFDVAKFDELRKKSIAATGGAPGSRCTCHDQFRDKTLPLREESCGGLL